MTTYPLDKLFVAAVTPWGPDGGLDEPQFRRVLEYFVSVGGAVDDFGIIVNPEAGEVFYLSEDEQARVLEIALDQVRGRMPGMTGLLANTTAGAAALAKRLWALGPAGLFIMPPIGALDITLAWDAVKYPEIWSDQIRAITEAVPDAPLVCHPVATASPKYGIGLPLEPTLDYLGQFPQIVGWKMTYNYEGFRTVSRAIRGLDRHVGVLGATAVNFHENLASGVFDGTVTGSFNYALEPMLEHITAWRAGDVERARAIWDGGLAELHEYVYETWGRLHVRYKTAAWLHRVIDSPIMRAPMPLPRAEEVHRLYRLIKGAGMDVQPWSEVVAFLDRLSPPGGASSRQTNPAVAA